jgi:hypothetical protein
MKPIDILGHEVHWKCNKCFYQNIHYLHGEKNYYTCSFCESMYYVTFNVLDIDGVDYDTR